MKPRLIVLAQWACAASALAAASAFAQQSWQPDRLMQIIVPITAGGGADIVLNMITPSMSRHLGQNIILTHKPGANSIIGTDALARSAPDGLTMGYVTDQLSINAQLSAKLPYDSSKFAPISQLVEGYFVLLANPKLGLRSLQDLAAAARAHPGKYTYATPGVGSPHHLSMELLKSAAGMDLRHIPFQGTPQMVTDVLGGHVDVMLLGVTSALEHVRAKRLLALAVTSPARLATAPDIPTAAEAGVPGFVASFWYGLLAPPGTPAHITERLSAEVRRALESPDVRKQLAAIDLEARPSTPGQFAAFLRRDAEKYAGIIKTSNVKKSE